MRHDAFAKCTEDPICNDLVTVDPNSVLMLVYDKTFENYANLTVAEREEAT